jgi:hypothetical protein
MKKLESRDKKVFWTLIALYFVFVASFIFLSKSSALDGSILTINLTGLILLLVEVGYVQKVLKFDSLSNKIIAFLMGLPGVGLLMLNYAPQPMRAHYTVLGAGLGSGFLYAAIIFGYMNTKDQKTEN